MFSRSMRMVTGLVLGGKLLSGCAARGDTTAIDPAQEPGTIIEAVTEPAQVPIDSEPEESSLLAPAPASALSCPQGTVEIAGDFCPLVVEQCLRWLDADHRNPQGAIDPNVCAEFKSPSSCVSAKRIPMHFCIDRYEWPNRAGEAPATRMSWSEASANCQSAGKRLCTREEWTFTCEGPDMKPYPYGDGYHRDSSACNMDVTPWVDPWSNPFERVDKRTPSGSFTSCRTDSGVYDLVGNVDEWVNNRRGSPSHVPYVSGLMGGHWVRGIRNQCRAITVTHEPSFSFYVTGARCCSDVREGEGPQAEAVAQSDHD